MHYDIERDVTGDLWNVVYLQALMYFVYCEILSNMHLDTTQTAG